jgi:hypothetical protein
MLIFESRFVRWEQIVKQNAYSDRIKPSAIVSRGLSSFPIPGRMQGWNLEGVTVSEEGVFFPDWGTWGIYSHFGAAKLLLIDPDWSRNQRLIAIARFVSEASWHSSVDTQLAFPEAKPGPLQLQPLADKFFYSDQPLGLHCGHIVDFLAWLMHANGIPVRRVALSNTASVGHIFMEAQLENGNWAYVDPDFGLMLEYRKSYISSDKAMSLRNMGAAHKIKLVDIGRKSFPVPRFNFQPGFSGQLAWSPAMMADKLIAEKDYYRNTVIKRGMEGLIYRNFKFDPNLATVASVNIKV